MHLESTRERRSDRSARIAAAPRRTLRERLRWATAPVLALSFMLVSLDAQGAGTKSSKPQPRSAGKSTQSRPTATPSGQADPDCSRAQETQRRAPSGSNLLQLALCHESQGKSATAYREFNRVIEQGVGTDANSRTARNHIDNLAPRISYLTIASRPGADLGAIQVQVDGVPLDYAAWGVPKPVDPGNHYIVASVGGSQEWSGRVTVGKDGDRKSVEIPVTGRATSSARAPSSAVVTTTPVPTQEPTPAATPPPPATGSKAAAPERAAGTTERLENPSYGDSEEEKETSKPSKFSRPASGYVLLGVGLASAGVGTYFGLRAISLRKDSDAECVRGCTQNGVDLNNQAKTAAWVSDIGIGVGALVFGIGSYILLKAPSVPSANPEPPAEKSESASLRVVPVVGPTGAAMTVGGAW